MTKHIAAFGNWCLVICWSLRLGHWGFSPSALPATPRLRDSAVNRLSVTLRRTDGSHPTDIPDIKLFVPKKHGDQRGFLSETFNRRAMAELGITSEFVQDNHSLSAEAGVVRGLHYQLPPMQHD